jgi:DNA-binding transcriptional LysR family regulator
MAHINLTQIEILIALVDTGNFADAARAIGVTQSAVSHGLARLETELGVTLVERGRRGVLLTEAGQTVLLHAREVISHTEAIQQVTPQGVGTGKLKIGMVAMAPTSLTIGLIQEFRRLYPAVELMLVEGSAQEIQTWLTEGLLDLAIVVQPSGKDVDCRPLVGEEIYALVPTSHELATKSVVTLAELFGEPLIVSMIGREVIFEALRACRESGRPHMRHAMSDVATIIAAIRAGFGIGLVLQSSLDPSLTDMVAIPLEPALSVELGLGIRNWETASPTAKLFLQIAEAWVR